MFCYVDKLASLYTYYRLPWMTFRLLHWEESDDPMLENEKTLRTRLGNRKGLTGLIVSPPRSNVCGIFLSFSVISFIISWRNCPPFFSKWCASLSLKILNLRPILLCSQTSMHREWCDLALGSETLKRAEKRQKTLIKGKIRLDFEYFVSIIFSKALMKKRTTRMGFEPTRAEHIGLAVQRLNHSATSSLMWWENTCMTTIELIGIHCKEQVLEFWISYRLCNWNPWR